MCGRFSLFQNGDDIVLRFCIANDIENYSKRYNIAPSQNVLVVINDGRNNRAGYLKWGLVPFWAKDPSVGNRFINARAETLAERAAFKHAFKKQRCLIVADGFYEWKKENKRKQPYRIQLKNNKLFAMAGLWDRWRGQDGKELFSCTIITTAANDLISSVHNRMPVILHPQVENIWLDKKNDDHLSFLQSLLMPYETEEWEIYPVSTKINSPKYDEPALIERV